MNDKIETEKSELASLESQLRQAADGMQGQASSPPNAPNAGDSTGAVADMLGSLTKSAAALSETASKAAGDLNMTRTTYGEIDQANADAFKNIG